MENVSTSEKYRKSLLQPPSVNYPLHVNTSILQSLPFPPSVKEELQAMKGEFSTGLIQKSLRRNVSGVRPEEDAGASVWRSTRDFSNPSPESWRSTSPTHLPLSLCNFQEVLFPDVPLWRGNDTQAFKKVHTLLCVPVGICIQ